MRSLSNNFIFCDTLPRQSFIVSAIDLNPLRKDDGYTVSDDRGHTYDFNVCGEVQSRCSGERMGELLLQIKYGVHAQ